jgi:Domain of unknown function (DUF4926)
MKLYDVVTLTADLPERELRCGQVGTVVEQLAPHVFEVEFASLEGETYLTAPVSEDRLHVLHHEAADRAV